MNLSVDRDKPVFKLLYLMGTHWPMVVDERCGVKDPPFFTTRKSATDQSRCSLIQLIDFFQSMQTHAIYDDALIIVLADHGAQLPPPRFKPAHAAGGVFVDEWIAAQTTPLLAIKRPSDSGPIRIS